MNYYNELKYTKLNENEKEIIKNFFSTFLIYIDKVEKHIFTSNEIKNDKYMDIEEKQDALKSLDNKRTIAHNAFLTTFDNFTELYKRKIGIIFPQYYFKNRSAKADLGAELCYNIVNKKIETPTPDGNIRDQLAYDIHDKKINIKELKTKLNHDLDIDIEEN